MTLQYPLNEKTSDFYRIFSEQRADKVTHHGYYYFYPRFLNHYRDMNIDGSGGGGSMLEIGIENKCSFRAWLNYFPKAFFYGIDIDFEDIGDRYEVFKADQSKSDVITDIACKITRPLFFVIDDGSHIPEHQILTFNILFEKLMEGGTYIIEDIETSYWTKVGLYGYETNYGFHHPKSLIQQFKGIIDDINSEFLNEQNKSIQNSIFEDRISEENRKNISSVTFGQNCVIIVKKTKEERILFDKPYVWSRCL